MLRMSAGARLILFVGEFALLTLPVAPLLRSGAQHSELWLVSQDSIEMPGLTFENLCQHTHTHTHTSLDSVYETEQLN